MVATPLTVYPCPFLQNAKESYLGHISNLFYILCGHFAEKKWGTTLPRDRVNRQSERVRGCGCNLPPFFCLFCFVLFLSLLFCFVSCIVSFYCTFFFFCDDLNARIMYHNSFLRNTTPWCKISITWTFLELDQLISWLIS